MMPFTSGWGWLGSLAASAIGYGLYETKMRPDQPRLLDGEFYTAVLTWARLLRPAKI